MVCYGRNSHVVPFTMGQFMIEEINSDNGLESYYLVWPKNLEGCSTLMFKWCIDNFGEERFGTYWTLPVPMPPDRSLTFFFGLVTNRWPRGLR